MAQILDLNKKLADKKNKEIIINDLNESEMYVQKRLKDDKYIAITKDLALKMIYHMDRLDMEADVIETTVNEIDGFKYNTPKDIYIVHLIGYKIK